MKPDRHHRATARELQRDAADFERLHSRHPTRMPEVARVHCGFASRVVRGTTELPLQ